VKAQLAAVESQASSTISALMMGHSARSAVVEGRQSAESAAAKTIIAGMRGVEMRRDVESLRGATEDKAISVMRATVQSTVMRKQVKAQLAVVESQQQRLRISAVVHLQSAYRTHFTQRYNASVVLQNAWWRHVAHRRLQLLKAAKETLARCLRARLQRRDFVAARKATLVLQRTLRLHLAHRAKVALVVQRVWRGFTSRKLAQKRMQAVCTVQAVWRGQCTRAQCSRKLAEIRERLNEATNNAEEHMKLGNRTSVALDILLNQKQITNILQALQQLNITTKFSAKCCARLVAMNGANIIVELMGKCNRSKPHQELLLLGLQIVGNIANLPYTLPALYRGSETAKVLLDLMQNFRDTPRIFLKGVEIFVKLCNTKDGLKMVNSIADVQKRLSGILNLMQRKVVVDQKQTAAKGQKNSRSLKELIAGTGRVKALIEQLGHSKVSAA